MAGVEKKSIDPASLKMIEKAASDEVSLVFDRAAALKPCPIGAEGSCCSNCSMGPCRIPLPRGREKPRRKREREGVSVGPLPRPLPPAILSA